MKSPTARSTRFHDTAPPQLGKTSTEWATASGAYGVSSAGEVGYGEFAGLAHAMLWQDSAASAVDLQPYVTALNPAFFASWADDIADNGSIVGRAWDGHNMFAVLWAPVPEPTTFVLLIWAMVARRLRRNSLALERVHVDQHSGPLRIGWSA